MASWAWGWAFLAEASSLAEAWSLPEARTACEELATDLLEVLLAFGQRECLQELGADLLEASRAGLAAVGFAAAAPGAALPDLGVLPHCDQIVPGLYLGGVKAVEGTGRVFGQGIRAVVCCLHPAEVRSCDVVFSNELEYFHVEVEDQGREQIHEFFCEAAEFINSRVSCGQPVLVHCRAGVSRSASVVIAFLVTHRGFSLRDAFSLVRSLRNCVCPNLGFIEQLVDHEIKIYGKTSVDKEKYSSWYFSEQRAAAPDLALD